MHVRRRMIGRVLLAGAAVIACGGLAVAAAPVQAGAVSCAAVAHEIGGSGAKAVVHRLFNTPDNRDWERLLDQVESGRPECVRLAKALRPGTDAASGETLNIALSRALETNPSEVLALGDEVFAINRICQDNNIEPTPEQHRNFMRRARVALSQVRAPALVARRDACLRSLGQ